MTDQDELEPAKGNQIARYGMAWDRLARAVGVLEPCAVEVLATIAERLVKGRELYGDLEVVTDPRDWTKELREEMADGAVYAACFILANGH